MPCLIGAVKGLDGLQLNLKLVEQMLLHWASMALGNQAEKLVIFPARNQTFTRTTNK